MVRETLRRLQHEFQPLLVIDSPRIDNRLRAAFDADLPLRNLCSHEGAHALRIETVVNTVQLLSRNPQLEILCACVSGMTDVGEQASVAEDGVNPGTQRRYLVGPRSIVIEDDPLSEQECEPGNPKIARVHKIRFPENAAKREAQATAEVPQHRGA